MKNIVFEVTKPQDPPTTRIDHFILTVSERVQELLSRFTQVDDQGVLRAGKPAPDAIVLTIDHEYETNMAFLPTLAFQTTESLRQQYALPTRFRNMPWHLCVDNKQGDKLPKHMHLFLKRGELLLTPV